MNQCFLTCQTIAFSSRHLAVTIYYSRESAFQTNRSMIQSYSPPASESSEHYDCFRSEITGGMRGANSGEIAIEEYENTGLPVPQESNGACRRAPPEQLSTQESRDQIEADELRDILKAETGYSSYIDYLRACAEKRPQLHKILDELTSGCRRSLGIQGSSFTILDLSNEDARLRVVSHYEDQGIMRIFKSLRQPPANVAVQILLCGGSLDEQSLDFLGLGLKISPFFFGAFYKFYKTSRPLLDSSHTRIGSAIATILRQYDPKKPDPVPIVLIAGWRNDLSESEVIEQGIEDAFQFQNAAIEKNLDTSSLPPGPYGPMHCSGLQWHTNYLQLLNMCLVKEKEQTVDITKLGLKPFLPFLYLNAFAIREFCKNLRWGYRGISPNINVDEGVLSLREKRHQLRELVEDSEDDLDYLRRYLCSQISADILSYSSWLKAEEDLIQIHQEARRLEVQVRDFLQLQVGEWALQESKKSIELSSRQIEEGKRSQSCWNS